MKIKALILVTVFILAELFQLGVIICTEYCCDEIQQRHVAVVASHNKPCDHEDECCSKNVVVLQKDFTALAPSSNHSIVLDVFSFVALPVFYESHLPQEHPTFLSHCVETNAPPNISTEIQKTIKLLI